MGFEGGRQARDPLVSGRLYAVATPIGNLDDISPRARRVLESVAVVACEDTRRTGKLFELLGLKRPELVRLDAHTEYSRSGTIVDRIVGGIDCAVVSDAGTPVVSDPGADLVRRAIDAGIEVVAVPGPSSVLAALVVSGLAADGFTFAGFLPRKGRARDERLAVLCRRPEPTVLFESPKRVAATLKDLAVAFGPDRLPFRLGLAGVVALGSHRVRIRRLRRRRVARNEHYFPLGVNSRTERERRERWTTSPCGWMLSGRRSPGPRPIAAAPAGR